MSLLEGIKKSDKDRLEYCNILAGTMLLLSEVKVGDDVAASLDPKKQAILARQDPENSVLKTSGYSFVKDNNHLAYAIAELTTEQEHLMIFTNLFDLSLADERISDEEQGVLATFASAFSIKSEDLKDIIKVIGWKYNEH